MKISCILVADSDPAARRYIRSNLEANGYQTCMAMDGAEAMRIIQKEPLDLILLNFKLPSINGMDLLRLLRQQSQVPVIILSDQIDIRCKIQALDLGADDYLTKPFQIEELRARIKNILRRSAPVRAVPAFTSFSCGNLKIKFIERQVTVDGQEIKLTPTEYNLLQELALNAEKVLTHSALLNKVWGPEFSREREYLRVFVGRLRKKLEPDPHRPHYIVTIPWVGYKLSAVLADSTGLEKAVKCKFS